MNGFETVFQLIVSRGAGSRSFGVHLVRSPGGEAVSADLDVNVVEELLQRRAAVEHAVQASVSKAPGQVGPLEKSVRELGTKLFEALFSVRGVSHRYHASLAVARERGEPLRVELRVEAPELAELPWEAMYDTDAGEYLCQNEPLIRSVPVEEALPPLSVDAPPLRILGITSAPRDQVRLDVKTAQEKLTAALAEAVGSGVVELEWAPDATWDTLQGLLQNEPWHAVHFIGHGSYDVRNGGLLYLVRHDGRSDPVEAKRFAKLLREARQGVPQLVVLNSCSSGASGSQDLFSGTGATLARSGVRAVAAMQFKVTIGAATAFSRSFYTALANGDGVDTAVRSGRRGILGISGHTLEWLTPVLYLRGNDTHLFTVRTTARLTELLGTKRFGADSQLALALRVHQAIDLPRTQPATTTVDLDPVLPTRVARDLDSHLQQLLADARTAGGFVVLVGDSSVGKTRLLYDTASAIFDGWTVLAPELGDGGAVNAVAEAAADAGLDFPPLVVWLDELHRFLPGPYLAPGSTPIKPATITRLLSLNTPVVILGAMWPEHSAELHRVDTHPDTEQQVARYVGALDILENRHCHELRLDTFSAAERDVARILAARDPRLATALQDTDFNVTEALAGVPALIRRYRRATTEERAVLHAAIDTRRLGVQASLTTELLATAARAYLTTKLPDDTWLQPALDALSRRTGPTDRSTAPLLEVHDRDHRHTIGYQIADYLLQHVTHHRRTERLPPTAWDALLDIVQAPDDLLRLGESAENRLLYSCATRLYRRAADGGHPSAAVRLVDLLAKRGDFDGAIELLRRPADAGDDLAAYRLAELLAEWRDIEHLRVRAVAGDGWATYRLVDLLVKQGDFDGAIELLRRPADASDDLAAYRLARLLARWADVELLSFQASTGRRHAAYELAGLLAAWGDVEYLRARADAADWKVAYRLIELLAEQRNFDRPVEPRPRAAGAGDDLAAYRLASLLAEWRDSKYIRFLNAWGDIEYLHARADAGDHLAAYRLSWALVERGGDEDEAIQLLRRPADAGDHFAAYRLVGVLVGRGNLDDAIQLLWRRVHADAGDSDAAYRLAELLVERGDRDQAIQLLRPYADAGDSDAAYRLAELLVERGDLEGLRDRAGAWDWYAAYELSRLLAERGDLDDAIQLLRPYADAGDGDAGFLLADFLAQGDVDGLRARADNGDWKAAYRLAKLLVERGDLEGLRDRAGAGDWYAAYELSRLLAERGDLDDAIQLLRPYADAGDSDAAYRLAELLVERGDLDDAIQLLRRHVHAGDEGAADELIEQISLTNREEGRLLRRYGLRPDGSIATETDF